VILRTVGLLLFYLLALLALVVLIPMTAVFGAREALLALGKGAMRVSRRVLGLRVEVRGAGHADPSGPAVFMANHESFLDGPLLFLLIPRPLRIIVKKSVFGVPVLGQGMRLVGFVPVDRKGIRKGRAAIERAAGAVREKGHSFLLFPEGTRSRTGALQDFRRGGFFLALESGAPIVPISIQGTFALMPKGRFVPRQGKIRVTFHPPVPMAGLGPDGVGLLIDRVRRVILSGFE